MASCANYYKIVNGYYTGGSIPNQNISFHSSSTNRTDWYWEYGQWVDPTWHYAQWIPAVWVERTGWFGVKYSECVSWGHYEPAITHIETWGYFRNPPGDPGFRSRSVYDKDFLDVTIGTDGTNYAPVGELQEIIIEGYFHIDGVDDNTTTNRFKYEMYYAKSGDVFHPNSLNLGGSTWVGKANFAISVKTKDFSHIHIQADKNAAMTLRFGKLFLREIPQPIKVPFPNRYTKYSGICVSDGNVGKGFVFNSENKKLDIELGRDSANTIEKDIKFVNISGSFKIEGISNEQSYKRFHYELYYAPWGEWDPHRISQDDYIGPADFSFELFTKEFGKFAYLKIKNEWGVSSSLTINDIYCKQYASGFAPSSKPWWEQLGDAVTSFVDDAIQSLSDFFGTLVKPATDFFDKIKSWIDITDETSWIRTTLVKPVTDTLNGWLDTIKNNVIEPINTWGNNNIVAPLTKLFDTYIGPGIKAIEDGFATFTDQIMAMGGDFVDFMTAMPEMMAKIGTKLTTWQDTTTTNIKNFFKDLNSQSRSLILSLMQNWWSTMNMFSSFVVTQIKRWGSALLSPVAETVQDWWHVHWIPMAYWTAGISGTIAAYKLFPKFHGQKISKSMNETLGSSLGSKKSSQKKSIGTEKLTSGQKAMQNAVQKSVNEIMKTPASDKPKYKPKKVPKSRKIPISKNTRIAQMRKVPVLR